MIKLELRNEPYWLSIMDGLKVRVRPLTTVIYEAAKIRGLRLASAAVAEIENVAAAGGVVGGLPDLTDEDGRAALSQFLFVKALALEGILEWRGVGGPDGQPLPATPEHIGELMHVPKIAEAFISQYTQPLYAVVAEGNASGPAPSGTLATGPDTAPDAGQTTPPVHEVSAD